MTFSPVTVFNLKSLGGPVALPSRYSRTADRNSTKRPRNFFFHALKQSGQDRDKVFNSSISHLSPASRLQNPRNCRPDPNLLPTAGSINLDHYLYGAPKQQP